MINREEFERYLANNENCELRRQGRDVYVWHNVYHATFGNHAIREVAPGKANRLLQDLGFSQVDVARIMGNF